MRQETNPQMAVKTSTKERYGTNNYSASQCPKFDIDLSNATADNPTHETEVKERKESLTRSGVRVNKFTND